MDRQTLERDPSLLETIVSLDWMSPTTVEARMYKIEDNLNARICFRPMDKQVWIIDGSEFRVVDEATDRHDIYSLNYHTWI